MAGANKYTRDLADVNGDGMADIVGFGQGGVYVSLATGGGNFAAPTFELPTMLLAQVGGPVRIRTTASSRT